MGPIALIDTISLLGFLIAVVNVLRLRHETLTGPPRAFLALALGAYVIVNVFNVLEHTSITAYFDRYEDYLEIVFIPLFLFFAFSWNSAIEVRQRIQAEREIRSLNEKLERSIEERTAELQASNRELESFCYSVSHDLRAPLRHIDGYSTILLEDFSPQLDAEARGYLDRVRSASQRMGQIIDDLLELSRVTRTELHRGSVDLSSLTAEIADELRRSDPGRAVEFRIADQLRATGDGSLIRIALQNLMDNAWKYTRKQDRALIEFGSTVVDETTLFFVRDNGAGFDMAYADKLFKPFQRLHRYDEFEGTGIGLATIHRIILRHGGTIWADSAVDGGTTFYFTLP